MNQRFGVGDVAILDNQFKVKIILPIQEENGNWWYEVESLEFKSHHREVRDSQLTDYKEEYMMENQKYIVIRNTINGEKCILASSNSDINSEEVISDLNSVFFKHCMDFVAEEE